MKRAANELHWRMRKTILRGFGDGDAGGKHWLATRASFYFLAAGVAPATGMAAAAGGAAAVATYGPGF